MTAGEMGPNVVKATALRAYPGWEVVELRGGTFYARDTRGIGIGPGETCFADAVYFAKHGEPRPVAA